MEVTNDMHAYKGQVRKRLEALNAVLKNAAGGDFTTLKDTPPDEFAALYAGINLLLHGAQEKIVQLNAIRAMEEALIESIGEGLISVDKNMRVMLMNGRAVKLLGLKRVEDALGRTLDEIMPLENEAGEPVAKKDRPFAKALALKRGKRVTVQRPYVYVRRKSGKPKSGLGGGERFPVHITASPIILNDEPVGVVSVFRDVTEENRIDHAKSEFISLASHQLRTPLSIISLNLEILFKHFGHVLGHQELREHLETIRNASTRMIELVSELLNVSKIELGTLDIVIEPVDLAEVVHESVSSIEDLAAKKDITVVLNLEVQVPKLETDRRLLRVVLDNLLSNAVKYSERGGKVEVTLKAPKSGGAQLSVRDEGCGIPEAEQVHVFTKMFRAHNVRRREEGGTGLGLYIAQSFLRALGGDISFVSREDKGTTFTLVLPQSSRATRFYAGEAA